MSTVVSTESVCQHDDRQWRYHCRSIKLSSTSDETVLDDFVLSLTVMLHCRKINVPNALGMFERVVNLIVKWQTSKTSGK